MSAHPIPHHVDAESTSLPTAAPPVRSDLDRFMRRLLRLPSDAPVGTAAEAQKAFQTSLLVAMVRCTLMYIVFPFILPAVGLAAGVGPAIGLVIGLVAIIAITLSIRRFWRADHSKRWHYTILGSVVLCFLVYLVIADVVDLFS